MQNARNRYKTKGKTNKVFYTRILRFEAKIGKVLQKHQKSITFFIINHMGVHHVEIPYKTNGKLMILRVPFRPKSDFGALADANLTECRNGTKIKFEIF